MIYSFLFEFKSIGYNFLPVFPTVKPALLLLFLYFHLKLIRSFIRILFFFFVTLVLASKIESENPPTKVERLLRRKSKLSFKSNKYITASDWERANLAMLFRNSFFLPRTLLACVGKALKRECPGDAISFRVLARPPRRLITLSLV